MPTIDFKGRKITGRAKPIEYRVLENGCWYCTSHSYRKEDGRLTIAIKGKKDYLYRFVYREFKGDIPDGLVVRHMCNNPYCLNPNHLEIGTHQDNVNDKVLAGKTTKGEKNPQNKYSLSQVNEAKEHIKKGNLTMKEISDLTGIGYKTLLRINRGELWKVEGEELKPNRKRSRYSLEKRNEIKSDLKHGMTFKEIQSKHNVSAGFISELNKELKGELIK